MADMNIWSKVLEAMANGQQPQAAPTPSAPVDWGKVLSDVSIVPSQQDMASKLQGAYQPSVVDAPEMAPSPDQVNSIQQNAANGFTPSAPVWAQSSVPPVQPQQAPVVPSSPSQARSVPQQVSAPIAQQPQGSPLASPQQTTMSSPSSPDSKSDNKWYETALQIMNPLLQVLGTGASIYSMAKYGRYGMPQIGAGIGQIGKTLGGVGKQLISKRQSKEFISSLPKEQQAHTRHMFNVMGPSEAMKQISKDKRYSIEDQRKAQEMELKVADHMIRRGNFERGVSKDELAAVNKAKDRGLDIKKQMTAIQKEVIKLLPPEEKEKFKDKESWLDPKSYITDTYTGYNQAIQGYMNMLNSLAQDYQANEQELDSIHQPGTPIATEEIPITLEEMKQTGLKPGQVITRNGRTVRLVEAK